MRRLLTALIVLALLALVLVAGGYWHLVSRDKTALRAELERELTAALGRRVAIAGELDFRLRPLPAVTVGGLTIANPEWAAADLMLEVGMLDLVPSIPALLRGRVVIHKLAMEDARLWLENGPDGQPNWRLPTNSDSDSPIRLQAVDLERLEVVYRNSRSGVKRTLTLDHMRLRGKRRVEPVEFDFSGELHGLPLTGRGQVDSLATAALHQATRLDLDVSLGKTSVTINGFIADQDFRDFSGTDLNVKVNGMRPNLILDWTELPIPEVEQYSLRGRLHGDAPGGDSERLALDDFELRMVKGTFKAGLSGSVDDLVTMTGLDLLVDGSGVSLKDLKDWIDLPWIESNTFSVKGRLLGTARSLRVEELESSIDLGNGSVAVGGRIGDLRAGQDVELKTTLLARRTGELSERLGQSIPDLDDVALSGTLRGSWSELAATDLQGHITEGGITAQLTGAISDLRHFDGIEVQIELDGTDLQDLHSLTTTRLPTTTSVKGSGRLTGSRHELDIDFKDLHLARGRIELVGSGSCRDLLDSPHLDAQLRMTGGDLRDAESLLEVELFESDRFFISGRLVGPLGGPDLEAIEARFVNQDIIIDVAGRLPDVFAGGRVDVRPIVRGKDISRLGDMLGQLWPTTDSFDARGRVHGNWARPALDDLDARLDVAGASMTLAGSIGDLLNGRDVNLKIQTSADTVTRFLPFGGRLWDQLGSVAGRFDLTGGGDDFVMDIHGLTAGASRLSGRFDLGLKDGDLVHVYGQLQDSLLDMTPWLGGLTGEPDTTPPKSDTSTGASQLFSPRDLPVSWMENLDMEVDFAGNNIVIGEGTIDVARGILDVDPGRMRVDPFEVDYRGAGIEGGFMLDARDVPRIKVRGKALSFDLGDMLRRMRADPGARGHIDLQFDFDATGASAQAMAHDAEGRIALLMHEGVLGRANLDLRLTQVVAGLVKKAPEDVVVKCAMVDLPIAAGRGEFNLFVLETEEMLMRGEGAVDFGEERFDMLLMPRPRHGRVLAHNANIRVTGPLTAPRYRLDARDTAATVAATIGRFALLGPGGLFINRHTFDRDRADCAGTLLELQDSQ